MVVPVDLVQEKLIRQHNALPVFKRGKRLFVAVSDPTNLQALTEISFHTGLNAEPVLAEDDKLRDAIETCIDAQDTMLDDLVDDDDLDNLELSAEGDDKPEDVIDATSIAKDAPVVRFVHKVLIDAIKKGASDIHLEPFERFYRVRFRLDGVLKEVAAPPVALSNRIAARVKVMARLDIAERRVPQDGRMKLNLSKNRSIDFRVSTCPTMLEEKAVIRILDPNVAKLGVESLGFDKTQEDLYMEAIRKPYGMVLVTGPTGSGKTVTLYSALNILNTEDRNISTVEDPVEINLPGVNQVNQNPRTGMTFAAALRAFLRQDPDVIMVGEIRDLETAEIAIKASQTGHMVLSTLHTNDASQTIVRLMNMGVAPFNITSSVALVVAQRLIRKLCEYCKKPADVPEAALLKAGFAEDQLKDLKLFETVGCSHCNEGYKGRIGIFEIIPITEPIARIILEGGNSMQIAEEARAEGYPDLRNAGLLKVAKGATSLAEVYRASTE